MTKLTYQGKQLFDVTKWLNNDPIILIIEVDFSIITEEMLIAIHEFFGDPPYRLRTHGNNVLFSVLDLAADEVIADWLTSNYVKEGTSISHFCEEGWPDYGIILRSFNAERPEPNDEYQIYLCNGDERTILFDSEE